MVRRGQVSFEFIAITTIAILLLTTSSYLMYTYSQRSTDQAGAYQVAQVGYEIIDQAKNVYVMGDGSFIAIAANMPEGIKGVYVMDNDTLVFHITSSTGDMWIPVFGEVPIDGITGISDRTYLRDTANPEFIPSGRREFRVTSKGDWVEVRLIS